MSKSPAQQLAKRLIDAAHKEAQKRGNDPQIRVMVTAYVVVYQGRKYLINVSEID